MAEGGSACGSGDDDQRGARLRARINRATTLYSVDPRTRTMMQPCASAAKLRGGGPILCYGVISHGVHRVTATSNRHRRSITGPTGPKLSGAFSNLRSLRRAQNDSVRHYSLSHEPPQGDQKLARQGHDHGLARAARVLGAGSKPLRQGTVLLEYEKSPRQLDHASPNARVARTRQPFLPAFCAALVGRAGEAGITRYSPSVAHGSRQHLLDQHVGRLDTNPDYARQQAHHCVWSFIGHALQTLKASILDLPDLITDQPTALHIATHLGQRVGRYWLALGRAQIFEALGSLLQFGIEAADAEPAQRCFHPVDNPSLLSDETLALAVGALGIFILDCRDCDHLAVITFAAQPTEKGAFEQLGVETVGLGAPVFTRYRHARCVDDMGPDAACPEPTPQPETIPAGLEGNCNAFDLASCFLRFLTPAIEKLQQCALVDRELLQRLALHARHDAGNQPARQTHFDHRDQCVVLFQNDTGLVQVDRRLHWGLHRFTSATMDIISPPPPHSISKRTMRRPTR